MGLGEGLCEFYIHTYVGLGLGLGEGLCEFYIHTYVGLGLGLGKDCVSSHTYICRVGIGVRGGTV